MMIMMIMHLMIIMLQVIDKRQEQSKKKVDENVLSRSLSHSKYKVHWTTTTTMLKQQQQ